MKTCPDCGQTKPLSEFPPLNKRKDGRHTYCRPCMNRRSKASRYASRAAAGKPVTPRRYVPDGSRWCPDCQTIKPLTDFPMNVSGRKGRGSYCRSCHNIRTRANIEKNYGSTREYHLRRRYGIGQAAVDVMLAVQDNACAGCGRPDPEHVDHDHATGEVRGMLCFNCNQALGNVSDDIAILENLMGYLRSFPSRWPAPLIPHQEIRFVGVKVVVDPDGRWHRREPLNA